MTTPRRGHPGGLDAIEARNALAAEGFRHLPDDIDLWRFREVLTKLGTELGLSAGAALYALDLTGLLTEADWRGDGRAVTFHSVRGYARKVGKSERTICEYERQLVAAGLVHRTLKHARRHGGQGCGARRTGLDWRAFGVRMPGLLRRLEERQETERRRLDIEARIRENRFIVVGLIEGMEPGRAEPLRAAFADLGIARLRGTIALADLESRFAALIALRSRIAEEGEDGDGDNARIGSQAPDRSEEIRGRKYTTGTPPSPEEICRPDGDNPGARPRRSAPAGTPKGMETKNEFPEDGSALPDRSQAAKNREGKRHAIDSIALPDLWKAAPESWKAMLGTDVPISWPALIEVAQYRAIQPDVGSFAWGRALHVLGPVTAALALMVLDRNRAHPTRPVLSVGAALVGMTHKAGQGTLDLAPSIHGIMGRREPPAPATRAGGS